MKLRKLAVRAACLVLLWNPCASAWAQEAVAEDLPVELAAAAASEEVVDVAIALDTSGSMELLIEAARLKLWEIVNDLTLIEPTPELRVALLTFGNNENDRRTGWVRIEVDFTRDLDLVSERLFELTSNGGTEYLGRVLETAVHSLGWTPSEEALKLLFVAGNEPADQDPDVKLDEVTAMAEEAGVSLHLVFCGEEGSEDAESWKLLAEQALGHFATIDHRTGPVAIESPFDEELAELAAAINLTYIPLGEEGQERWEKLADQDEKIRRLSPAAAATRADFKSSRAYSAEWDLVDAVESGQVELGELDGEQLPELMQTMDLGQREAYVLEMQGARRELRERITSLSEQRRRYVADEIKARRIDTSRAFDTVVRQAIRERLEERGFWPNEG